MAVESAKFIKQLDASLPLGGDSISEGDNHIRVIKEAVTGSFPNIDSVVTATPAELNEVGNIKAELDALEAGSHGNVASCYYVPNFQPGVGGVDGLVYGHNIAKVEAVGSGALAQTHVIFTSVLPDMGNRPSHFAFNFTPVDGSGSPVTLKVSNASDDRVGFIAWKWINDKWESLPGGQVGFTLIVIDMDAGQ